MLDRKRLEDDPALEPVMNCSICFEKLTHPKLLGCSHSFCKSCLIQMERHGAGIKCPLCTKITALPLGGITNLTDDFRHNTLVDCLREIKLEDYQSEMVGRTNGCWIWVQLCLVSVVTSILYMWSICETESRLNIKTVFPCIRFPL